MIYFAQEEGKDERKLKLCPGTFTGAEPLETTRMHWDPSSPDPAPPGDSPPLSMCWVLPGWRSHFKRFPVLVSWESVTMKPPDSLEQNRLHFSGLWMKLYIKRSGLLLTCAWPFISPAWAFLEMGSEINSFRHDHEIRGWESGLEKLLLSSLAFQVSQNSVNLLTDALMTCRAIPGLPGVLPFFQSSKSLVVPPKIWMKIICTCWLYG